ncbi:MAG: ketoacid CoA transferase [Gammaproteobacteria bacterium]|nr:ketoacid CoA transferase [Gammaproteobacteria bacterium]MDE0366874.1 ketoacid CoA transferase [Gammaproteobacteria bacterium]
MACSLAELCVCAAAEAFRGEGETMVTSIGLVPRLAASLAKSTFAPGLMMTEGEAYLVSEPVPVGPRGDYRPKIEGLMTYERVFDIIYRGMRHAMVTPVQVDRYGQMNISVIGDYARPKAALLGVRGYPGNTVNNANSMFVPSHDRRTFVAGEVDMVAGAGYNPARWPGGRKPEFLDLRRIVSNLAVMDFQGAGNAIRVISLHPGVTFEEVQDNTGFALEQTGGLGETAAPTARQLGVLDRLDPHNLRATVFKGNPPGRRAE